MYENETPIYNSICITPDQSLLSVTERSSKVAHRLKTLFLESGVARVLVVFKNEQLKIYL